MTNQEIIIRNIDLTFDFLRKICNDPSVLDEIPNGAIIEFVDKDIPSNKAIKQTRGRKYIKVKNDFEIL